MVQKVVLAFQLIINFCWDIISYKCIAGTYSLWNVFQGIFAIWAFKVIITDGILKWSNISHGSHSYGRSMKKYDSQVTRKDVN